MPYAIHDYARRYERNGTKIDKSEVLRKNKIWVACQTDDDLPYVLKFSGDDMLVIGTDYGHNDTSSEILALRKLREDGIVPTPVVNKILDDNAQSVIWLIKTIGPIGHIGPILLLTRHDHRLPGSRLSP